ncbi:MAG: replication-relaxation family protein [Terriglobales bacterium]|jgi:hypothetical protein
MIQIRDRELLAQLHLMRFADRNQIMAAAGFNSLTRINTRLLALHRAGLLRRFFVGLGPGKKAIYSLSPKGAQLIGLQARGPRRRQNSFLVDFSVLHQLAVNDVYCNLRFKPIAVPGVRCTHWIAFTEPIAKEQSLIPDGYAEFSTPRGIDGAFLEIDLGTEELKVWKEKARNYVHLAASGEFARQFSPMRFRVLVLADSARRLEYIRSAVAEVTEKIFWFATLEETHGDKFYSRVWLRPKGSDKQPLFEQSR